MLTLQYTEKNLNIASLFINKDKNLKMCKTSPAIITISECFTEESRDVEAFIKNIYKKYYNARIKIDYPILMSIWDNHGNILSAVGLRYAANGPLFLENYTKAPIENFANSARDKIVEIGNLASTGEGASTYLFVALASYLHNKGIRHASVTGTGLLHRYFQMIGLNPQKICDADISSLEKNGQDWGSYYAKRPRVLIGSIEAANNRLQARFGSQFKEYSPYLSPYLHYRRGH
jgi:hypothetical protein